MITDVWLWTGVTPKSAQSFVTSQFAVSCGLFGLAVEQPVYTSVTITTFEASLEPVKNHNYTVNTDTLFIGTSRVFTFALNCIDFRRNPCFHRVE